MFAGKDASEDQLNKLDLTQYRMLHFATHAIGSLADQERPALVFSPGSGQSEDGLLHIDEISQLADLLTKPPTQR